MSRQKLLDSFRMEMDGCARCTISKTCTQKVFGEGSADSKAISIAEAPGKDEDVSGVPLSGRAGRYWDSMLETADWLREELFITNALLCRPVDNKIEGFEELDNCRDRLLKQIAIIEPQLILLFGKVPAYSLGILNKQTFSKKIKGMLGVQSVMFMYDGLDGASRSARVVWLYHPSYLMRGQTQHAEECAMTYTHLRQAREIYEELD